ncbi:MAG: hypothetical protein FIA90_14235 [candidate division NC10 bacterium]|nr:hypothetical protein [candidate division NC10 bacterium]
MLTLLLVPEAWGAVRYVAMSGKNNPTCTQAVPCRTIQYAVDIAGPGDTISIGKGKFLESFGVIIDKDLTINGAGIFSTRVFGGWPGYSVFHIQQGATVTITRLDVMFGHADNGGGISNRGHLAMEYVRLWSNSAKINGGGIYNDADSMLSISKSEIAHNSAGRAGGGLYNLGIVSLNEVRIVKNDANIAGGGIQNGDLLIDVGGASNATIERSEISYNEPFGIDNAGWMSLINTTVSSNAAVGINDEGGHTVLTHVTVAENGKGPTDVPSGLRSGLGGTYTSAGEFALFNTIVANNATKQCNLGAASLSATGSLISDGTCGSFWSDTLTGGTLVGVDPKLGPLKPNGGSTHTHALKSGSPAIDAGFPGACASVDQRGVLRSIDGNGDGQVNCDIGAFEYVPLKRGLPTDLNQ